MIISKTALQHVFNIVMRQKRIFLSKKIKHCSKISITISLYVFLYVNACCCIIMSSEKNISTMTAWSLVNISAPQQHPSFCATYYKKSRIAMKEWELGNGSIILVQNSVVIIILLWFNFRVIHLLIFFLSLFHMIWMSLINTLMCTDFFN